ncbi:MAG: SMC-Scp complex subunit ScpB [Candidatus Zixiibacteriota bacterium]|jgi:segregation and condensation protein B
MNKAYTTSTVEALILASPEPLPGRKISQVLEELTPSKIAEAISELNNRYATAGMSFRIRELAGGYQFYILPEYVGFVEELFTRTRKLRLTRPALETVAIVAYRQPVTKTEIEHIRGVASDGVIHNLLDKGLITIKGRANTVGKPLQYGTTDEFLRFFGLNSLDDLPRMSEIEELVSAADSKFQTELELEALAPGQLEKLNIVDGTFDPSKRRETSEHDDDGSEESSPEITVETGGRTRLVLRTPAQSEASSSEDEEGEETPDVLEKVNQIDSGGE